MIRTKGRRDGWIITYTIEYSRDDVIWDFVTLGGTPMEFPGNTDRSSEVDNTFDPPITARYVRLGAVTWQTSAACQWKILYTSVCTGKHKSLNNKSVLSGYARRVVANLNTYWVWVLL